MNQAPEGYFALIGNYYVVKHNFKQATFVIHHFSQQENQMLRFFKKQQMKIGKTIGRGTFGKVKMGLHTYTLQNRIIKIILEEIAFQISIFLPFRLLATTNFFYKHLQKVAIKILDKDKIVDESDKIRVAREIQILRKIRHPNIIQLYEIIESQTQLFLITEYAPNSELFDFIVKRNRLNERQSARFLLQILSAVEYLHQNNIVHRDLKPENLLLDYNNSIKVVDFGLSNMYEEGQTLKTACGSPCYAAPEMVSGKRYEGLKTDIWSCGIILYAMLCGYLPFEDQNTTDLYKKIINEPVKLPKFLTERSKSILNGILEKDPEKRLTIEQIRKHDFCVLNSNQPILKGIIFGKDEILADPYILQLIKEQYGIDSEQARVMIQNNKHNQITATYYLLLNSHIRNGGVSIADLSRPPTLKKLGQIIQPHPQSAQKDSSSNKKEDFNFIGKSSSSKNVNSDTKVALSQNYNLDQQYAQPQNIITPQRGNIHNRQAPNKSSTPMKKTTEYKSPTSNFEQYVAQQQKIKEKQQEKSPQSKEKSSPYLTSPLIESPNQEKEGQKYQHRKYLQDEKSPILITKSSNNTNSQGDEDSTLKQSPNFAAIVANDQIITQGSVQKKKQEEINFIKSHPLTESIVKKQNFFQEEEEKQILQQEINFNEQSKNQNDKQFLNDQVNQSDNKNNHNGIPNSTFGGSFKLDENGSQSKNVKLPIIEKDYNIPNSNEQQRIHQKLDSNNKPNQDKSIENSQSKEQKPSQNSHNDFGGNHSSKEEKSDEEYNQIIQIVSPQKQIMKQNRPVNHPRNSRSTGIPSTSQQQYQQQQQQNGINNNNSSQSQIQTNNIQNKGNGYYLQNISASKQQNRQIIVQQKSKNGQETNQDANKTENAIFVPLQNSSGIYSSLKQEQQPINFSNLKTSSAQRRVNSKDEAKNDNIAQLQLQIIQSADGSHQNQQNIISNKSGSKVVLKIHQKTKSDSGISRKGMNFNGHNQKENLNTEQDQIMQSPAFKSNINTFSQSTNTQIKNTNEKISNLIRSANQKGGLNVIQKELSSNPYKQHLPNFFNNQSYLAPNPQNMTNNTINHFMNNSHNNNLIDSTQQANQSANNYYSKQSLKTPTITEPTYHETSSVRQKLKQISQRHSTIQSSNQTFKVRIRKSATPELNNINSNSINNNLINNNQQLSINGQYNYLSQQYNRINKNINISNQKSNQNAYNQTTLSPEKRIKTKQVSRSSRRFVSAERENNQIIQQSLLDDPTKNKFFRQGSSSIQKNIQTFLNIIEKNNKQSESMQVNGESVTTIQIDQKRQENNLQIPSINREIKEPKIRVISESPMYKKDQQSNESKYYLGLKQQMILKEPLICNFSINNDSNINHQLTNNDGINSTMDEITQQKSIQKLTSWPHSQNYYLNVPINSNSNNNKSYLNNISNSSRISANINDQLQQSLQQPTIENSKSELLKLKTVSNSLITNSYSLVNVQKYKVRKSKINSGLHNISNSIMGVNHVVNNLSIKDKQ